MLSVFGNSFGNLSTRNATTDSLSAVTLPSSLVVRTPLFGSLDLSHYQRNEVRVYYSHVYSRIPIDSKQENKTKIVVNKLTNNDAVTKNIGIICEYSIPISSSISFLEFYTK